MSAGEDKTPLVDVVVGCLLILSVFASCVACGAGSLFATRCAWESGAKAGRQ